MDSVFEIAAVADISRHDKSDANAPKRPLALVWHGPRTRCAACSIIVGDGGRGAGMDVGGWLRKLGVEQYEPAFRENKIDSKILPKLTAEDLRDLGVTLVGDRLRMLDAIASLRDEAMPPGEGIARLGAAVRDDGGGLSRSDAERRQLTIMFFPPVGPTSLPARFDPEHLLEVIGAYHRVVAVTH